MRLIAVPMLLFIGIQFAAVINGMTDIATLGCSGALLCCGIFFGWESYGKRKGEKHRSLTSSRRQP